MTKKKPSPLQRLINRHVTRKDNLRTKRANLIADFEAEKKKLDDELADIEEILRRLDK